MSLIFSDKAWEQYLDWDKNNKKLKEKIEALIKDIKRNGLSKGIGKPEPLKDRKEWSRRIDSKHRLVYTLDSENNIIIISCYGHYEK